MRKGVVVYYNAADGKHFGFIRPEDAPNGPNNREHNVFFHNTRQFHFSYDGGDEPGRFPGFIRFPKVGDRVLFDSEKSAKGERAIEWALEETLLEAQRQIETRKTYRLRQRRGVIPKSRLWEKPEYRTLWEGKNLSVLRAIFKPYWHPLFEREDAAVYFEVLTENGWVKCDDPR